LAEREPTLGEGIDRLADLEQPERFNHSVLSVFNKHTGST
jgi:hypothetical protein